MQIQEKSPEKELGDTGDTMENTFSCRDFIRYWFTIDANVINFVDLQILILIKETVLYVKFIAKQQKIKLS